MAQSWASQALYDDESDDEIDLATFSKMWHPDLGDDGDDANKEEFVVRGRSMVLFNTLQKELLAAAKNFWLRRNARRKLLLQVAEECALFGSLVRRRAAELRFSAARRRLDMLKSGDMAGYAAMLDDSKEGHLKDIIEETARILGELNAPRGKLTEEVEQPSILQNITLMPHQLEGLRWLVNLTDNRMTGGILADDMGLGKTAQSLALLAYLKEHRHEPGPHLALVPLSTLSQWADSVETWLPDFKFLVFKNNKGCMNAIKTLAEEVSKSKDTPHNLIITTYDMVLHNPYYFSHIPWHTVIVDEGHKIKNSQTKFSQVVRTFPCQHRLLLTGTPIQNSLRELWSLLSFVAPDSFGSLDDFEQWFALPPPPTLRLRCGDGEALEEGDETAMGDDAKETKTSDVVEESLLSEEEELLVIQRLHRVLEPFLLRRTKSMVLADLPKKSEVVIWTPLSSWQTELYKEGMRSLSEQSNENVEFVGSLAYLRKVLNHPYHLLDGALPNCGGSDDRFLSASGKFELLDRILPRLVAFRHKVLIFSQMTTLLDLLELLLARLGIRFERIDGATTLKERQKAAQSFLSDPQVSVLLLTTRAGGVGLNLQAADTVILLDSDWNPQVDLQAMDRAHRIGQHRPVLVIRLASPVPFDRGLLARASSKINIEQKVIGAGRFAGHGVAEDHSSFVRQLISLARQKESERGREATPIEEVSSLIARSFEELGAFNAADLDLLGPPAATESGAPEPVERRLERAGRLLGSDAEATLSQPAFKKLRLSRRNLSA